MNEPPMNVGFEAPARYTTQFTRVAITHPFEVVESLTPLNKEFVEFVSEMVETIDVDPVRKTVESS